MKKIIRFILYGILAIFFGISAINSQTQQRNPGQITSGTINRSDSAATLPANNPRIQQMISNTESNIIKSRLSRTQEREAKRQHFIAGLDSLVNSRMFQFVPISMQNQPGGNLQMIYNFYYYIAVINDKIEVHVPIIRGGVAEYIDILNFNSPVVRNYAVNKTLVGWNVSFSTTAPDGTNFTFAINLYTTTGEAIMNLITPTNTIKYTGTIEKV